MTEIDQISGVGSSKTVNNLLAKLEESIYGIALDHEDSELFHNINFNIGFQKINIEYGKEQKRASQACSEEERKNSGPETSGEQDQRAIFDAGHQTNGGCRSSEVKRAPITTAVREFYRELQSDFDRQHIHRRSDGKLVVQIFEYFKYLDFNKNIFKVENYLTSPFYLDFNYHICSSKREDNDLILIVDANTSFRLYEDKMLFYPLLNLDIKFPKYKITNEGFYIKWDSSITGQ